MSDQNLWFNQQGQVVHPNAPLGGGGPGNFKSAVPLGVNHETQLSNVAHPFSPLGRNSTPTEEQVEQLDGGKPDVAVPDETPTFTSTTGVPNDVRADTVDEFISGSNAAMGDGDTVGHMKPTINFDSEFDDKGNISKVNMVVNTQIVRPRFAGGRPTDSDRELIKQAEALIKAHEEHHRDIAKDYTARACKAMRGKSATKAKEAFDKIMKEMDKAQADFDAKEGRLFVDHNGPNGKAGPATGVRTGPVK